MVAALPRRRKRALRRTGALLLLGVCSALAIWSERKTIGTSLIDRKLAAAHVRARYRIADLGFGRQRLVNVVIGDPDRPDLVADWIELRTRIGLDGANVTAVSAGGLRVRAFVENGRLSLGEIDRLLPDAGGAGFRLPAIDLNVADARATIRSPLGAVTVSLTGKGRLDDGFRGRMTAVSERLSASGCAAPHVALASSVKTDRSAVSFAGRVRSERIACQGASLDQPDLEIGATLAAGLSSWRGRAEVRSERATISSFTTRAVRATIDFAGTKRETAGEVALTGGAARIANLTSCGVMLSGRYRIGDEVALAGTIRATGAATPASFIADLRRYQRSGAGTPIGPLVAQGAAALGRAASEFDVAAQVTLAANAVSLTRADAVARSGARFRFVTDEPVRLIGGRIAAISGTAHVSGDGLPTATVRFVRPGEDAPVRGVASIDPYAAGGARLALEPVEFEGDRRRARLSTIATLSGPLFDGQIEGLRIPVSAEWSASQGVSVGSGCIPISIERLRIATLRVQPVRTPVCADGPALIRVRDDRLTGGARIPNLRVTGTLGANPVTLAGGESRVALADRRLETRQVSVALGVGESATRLAFGRLVGVARSAGFSGRIEDAGGRIGKVPLALSDASGDWRFGEGALTLVASASVADTSADARFRPLRADGIKFRLEGGAITATGRLVTPDRAVRVADVSIAHDLNRGAGEAKLDVPALNFTESFQPDLLTPLTFGVIADVRGAVSGKADIAWSASGVTSTGTFHTDGLDLAASVGPVRGLAGTIRFTDLLQLESAPDQVATIASINPGVPVEDGRVAFQLLSEGRVRVASGRWPFAGGSLELRPTTLAFDGATERRLTFALDGVDAGLFLQQFNFGNLSATGTFDGTLPMIFDANGGRIEAGELRVRQGGGNIAYLGELTKEDLGTWGTIAFQALRSIDYRDLAITMNGPLAGEMITEVRFAGVSQGKGARSNFLIRRLQKLPFVFNIRIRAPFRGLIDSAQSFYDPSRLISRNLPALIRRQNEAATPDAAIQAGESGPQP